MMGNDIRHIKDLIEEIDILLGLLKDSDSLLYNKEYKEKIVYNSKSPSESNQKDLILVGEALNKSTSYKIVYVNDRAVMCESGA